VIFFEFLSISPKVVRRTSESSSHLELFRDRQPLKHFRRPTMPKSSPKTLNRLLWTAQTLAALLFLFAGSMKFIMPAEKMQQGPIVFSMAFMHFIGICECLGALGLLLPGLARVQTWLTPLAAAGLTIIMIGATTVTILSMGVAPSILPAVVGIVTVWIAYGRTRLVPISDAPRHALRTA
jgi:hypothetical protein